MFDKITAGNWITLTIVAAGLVSAWALTGYRLNQVELTEAELGEKIKTVMGNTVSNAAFNKVADELANVHLEQVRTTAILNISFEGVKEDFKEVWTHIEALQITEHEHE